MPIFHFWLDCVLPAGGVVLVGVDTSSTTAQVLGCQPLDSQFVQQTLDSHIQPPIATAIAVLSINSKSLIAIDVAPAQQAHGVGTNIKNLKYYQRCGSATVPLSAADTSMYISCFNRSSPDSIVVSGATLDYSSTARCYELGLVDNPVCSTEQQQQVLQSSGLLDPTTQCLTRAGLLLTGTDNFQSDLRLGPVQNFIIQGFYSSSYDSAADALRNHHFDVQKTFHGPIMQQVHEAATWVEIVQHTPYVKRLEEVGGSTVYAGRSHRQYAAESIWELLVNAVCHRDYNLVSVCSDGVTSNLTFARMLNTDCSTF